MVIKTALFMSGNNINYTYMLLIFYLLTKSSLVLNLLTIYRGASC